MIPYRLTALALLLPLIGCGDSGTSPGESGGLQLTPADSGYDFPVLLTAPPGDRHQYVVVERAGRVLLTRDGVRQDSAFLNITDLTNPSSGEFGLYGLAFHPQYASNHKLYIYYVALDGDVELVEYQTDASGDHVDLTTRRRILAIPMAPTTVLYGGNIVFGKDGMLYAGIGDGHPNGAPNQNAQDSTRLQGKLLRLNVDAGATYTIPPDNPYVGRAGWREEIWQLGLRNPWRWSFDDKTGALWIGDVGEDRWEEINLLPAPVVGGNNFGWPVLEGTACLIPATNCETAGLVPPIMQYDHGATCSIVGGRVYRGKEFPRLDGVYFYGDFCGGWVRSVRLAGAGVVQALPALASPIVNDNVVSFGADGAGELYVVMASGYIYRITA